MGLSIPERVMALAAGRALELVWRNELGGLTFAIEGGQEFVKWTSKGSEGVLVRERERLVWARRFARVPEVVAHGRDQEGAWLVTMGLGGRSAVESRWLREPAKAVRAIGAGLRALHDSLPVAECPFSWSVEARLAEVRRLAAGADAAWPERWHAEHRGLGVAGVLAALAAPPAVDRLVVCHGDSCAPNTLLDEHGSWLGHVDLGALGVADRWADLAIATWSAAWNYGPGWESALLDAYGIAPDPIRTRYYRLLSDLGP